MRLSTIAPLSVAALLTATAFAAPGKKKPAPKGGASPAVIAQGAKSFKSAGCIACHVMDGKGGKTGPDLTHAGKIANADKIFAYCRDPKKFKKDAAMPAVAKSGPTGLTDPQLKAVSAFLASKK